MLGRKNYTREELAHANTEVGQQLAEYKRLVGAASDPKVRAALEVFEPLFFNNMILVLTATSSTGSAWSRARTAIRRTRSS